jgi:hypothetical protein
MALMAHEGENLTSGWRCLNFRSKIWIADAAGAFFGQKMEQRVCAEQYLVERVGELTNVNKNYPHQLRRGGADRVGFLNSYACTTRREGLQRKARSVSEDL